MRHARVARALVALALVAIVAACAAPPAPSASPGATAAPPGPASSVPAGAIAPTRLCDTVQEVDPAPFSCTDVIGRVLLALGPDARSVQAAWFRPGSPCPPNARCIAPPRGSSYVVVRLESGAVGVVRVAFEGGELIIGQPEDPTYDIWPSTGETAPAPAVPDVGPGAPEELTHRDPLPQCVDERRPEFVHTARQCFFEAILDGRGAELVRRTVDEAGDPVVEVYRYTGRGPVLVYRNGNPAGPGWVRSDCAIGPANDDQFIFVVAECLSTELS